MVIFNTPAPMRPRQTSGRRLIQNFALRNNPVIQNLTDKQRRGVSPRTISWLWKRGGTPRRTSLWRGQASTIAWEQTDSGERPIPRGGEKGFTYFELAVVVAIIAVTAAYVAIRMGTTTSQSAEALAELICTDIRRIQGLAMKENTSCELRFASTQCRVIKGGADYTDGRFPFRFASFPEFSEIRISPDATLCFNSRGQPVDSAGSLLPSDVTIQLTSDGKVQKTIRVIAQTGHVEIH